MTIKPQCTEEKFYKTWSPTFAFLNIVPKDLDGFVNIFCSEFEIAFKNDLKHCADNGQSSPKCVEKTRPWKLASGFYIKTQASACAD